jgi:2-iminoacetate synthase ThiH
MWSWFAASKRHFRTCTSKPSQQRRFTSSAKSRACRFRKFWKRLIEAGLGSLPGGGAEVLTERIHRLLYPRKASPKQWLEVHRVAHKLGLKSNATLLYGHIETPEEKAQHFELLRQLQDETGGFMCFIPLAYHPANTKLGGKAHDGCPRPQGNCHWPDLCLTTSHTSRLTGFPSM